MNIALAILLATVLTGCSMFGTTAQHSAPPPPAPAPTVAPAMRDSSQTPDQIRAVQQKLADGAFYTGPIDGLWGGRTSAALSTYQRTHALDVTGKLDGPTLDALGLANTPVNTAN